MSVCATQARIASHAHAMPPATQPAVTRASPILLGCRILDGQVHCDAYLRVGGVRAGRVACERPESLSLSESSLFEYRLPAIHTHIVLTALIISLSWDSVR